jgi:hypothetical protein
MNSAFPTCAGSRLHSFTPPQAGFSVCYVCGEGYEIVNGLLQTDLGGTNYTCSDVEELGLSQNISETNCGAALIEQMTTDCGCQEVTPTALSATPQTVEPTPAGPGAASTVCR